MDRRKVLEKAGKIICFLAILCLLINAAGRLFSRKQAEEKYREFYENPGDYDVLFTGISHMQVGVSPMELWNDYGIASFNLAEPGTRIPYNYWVIKSALEYSSPRLVAVDVRRIGSNDLGEQRLLHTQFDRMPLSLTKIRAILDLYQSWDDRIEMLAPFTVYHNRWSELGEADFPPLDYRPDKGASHWDERLQVAVPGEYEIIPETEKKTGDGDNIAYLRKIIEMCQEKGIEVLLVNIPYPPYNTEQQLYENGVADIAEEYGINYINFLHIDGIVNYNTDIYDVGHLNDSGMKKTTAYLGNYIRENYDIPDRREDPAYDRWKDDYVAYTDYKFEMLERRDGADTYLNLLADKNIHCCIYVKKESSILTDYRFRELIQNVLLGGELERFQEAADQGEDYLLIVDRGEEAFTEFVGSSSGGEEESSFGMVSFGRDDNGNPYLKIDYSEWNYLWWEDQEGNEGLDYDADGPDIQMVAIDAATNTVRSIGRFEENVADPMLTTKKIN